jgi:hypothetical protein
VQSEEKTIEGVNFSIHHAEAKVSNSMCKDKMHERYICGDSENFTVGLLICIMVWWVQAIVPSEAQCAYEEFG